MYFERVDDKLLIKPTSDRERLQLEEVIGWNQEKSELGEIICIIKGYGVENKEKND